MILATYTKYISDMTYYIDIDFYYERLNKNTSGGLLLQGKILKVLFSFSFIITPFKDIILVLVFFL